MVLMPRFRVLGLRIACIGRPHCPVSVAALMETLADESILQVVSSVATEMYMLKSLRQRKKEAAKKEKKVVDWRRRRKRFSS